MSPRRPMRLFASRCRACGQITLGWPHKLALYALAVALVALALQVGFRMNGM